MSLLPRGFVHSDATESTRRARLLPFLAAAEATVAIVSAVCLWVFVWDATEALLADTALNRLFRDQHRIGQRVRGIGMRTVDALTPLKHWLMLRAMGDAGDVPAIAALRPPH